MTAPLAAAPSSAHDPAAPASVPRVDGRSDPAPRERQVAVGSLEHELSRTEGRKWLGRLSAVAAATLVATAAGVWWTKTRPAPPARYVTAVMTRGDVVETVQSTGQVKPTTEVQIGAQVSGRITKVYVDFNSEVRAGDVLAEIDPTLFGAQIDGTRAELAAATANVSRAEANLATFRQRVVRAENLVREGIGTQADLDNARGAYDAAVAEVAAAKAQVAQIGAHLRSSKTNLDYTRIYSPIDGIVINRAIDPGQTVAASFQAPVLFVIAQDLRKMRVLADIDEADVGKLREGMRAKVRVDAFSSESFDGGVRQVRYSPFTQSGVVTYAAVIEVDNPELKLRPGMTATATITTAEAKGVLRVPNAALRYRPTPAGKNGNKAPQEPLPPLPPKKGRIWVVTDETPGSERVEPRVVDVGITDGIHTEVTADVGALKIVTDEVDDPAAKKSRGPRMF